MYSFLKWRMQSCTLCPQLCISFLKEYTVGDQEFAIASNPTLDKRTHKMDKEYIISKRKHHFTRKSTRF